MDKWHYVYMTINLKNNKKYIGKRTYRGDNILDDNYLGSGKVLKKAIKKYGEKSFKKIIIAICKTEEDAYGYEKTLIEQLDAVDRKDFYNLSEGHASAPDITVDDVQTILLDASTGDRIKCAKNRITSKITNIINRIIKIIGSQ